MLIDNVKLFDADAGVFLDDRAVTVEEIPTSAYPTPARRPLNSRLDCSSLTSHFGITRPDWRAATHQIVKSLT